jgi:hypothetical protein
MFPSSSVDQFLSHASRCNDVLSSVHEGCSPYYTSEQRKKFEIEDDYGGITGTITPGHVGRFARVLLTGKLEDRTVLEKAYLLQKHESVVVDIGSGTGRPTFYFAGLELKCSMGFDIDSLQVGL